MIIMTEDYTSFTLTSLHIHFPILTKITVADCVCNLKLIWNVWKLHFASHTLQVGITKESL